VSDPERVIEITVTKVEGPNVQNWHVYIAKARTQRFYTGITTDPEKRIVDHNLGIGSKFAINQGPLQLLYVSAPCATKSEARKREVQIKNWSRIKKLKLINGEWV
jgi:putative endonuclease